MRLYLDSSAVVARYFSEPHTLAAPRAIAAADTLASSHTAYAEVRATLARLRDHKRLAGRAYREAVADFERDWTHFDRLEVTADLALAAGALAASHRLKGYDAIHLASALAFASEPEGATMLTFDRGLIRAARAVNLALVALKEM